MSSKYQEFCFLGGTCLLAILRAVPCRSQCLCCVKCRTSVSEFSTVFLTTRLEKLISPLHDSSDSTQKLLACWLVDSYVVMVVSSALINPFIVMCAVNTCNNLSSGSRFLNLALLYCWVTAVMGSAGLRGDWWPLGAGAPALASTLCGGRSSLKQKIPP